MKLRFILDYFLSVRCMNIFPVIVKTCNTHFTVKVILPIYSKSVASKSKSPHGVLKGSDLHSVTVVCLLCGVFLWYYAWLHCSYMLTMNFVKVYET